MPRAFSEEEREKIRSRLIASGKRLLNKVGVRLLTIDDVVKDAGISKGSFYSFFPSREDFILSVFEEWEAEFRGSLIKEVTEGGGSPREKMERFFSGAFAIFDRETGLAQIGIRDIQSITDRLPPERLALHQANDSRVLEETFSAWARKGIIPPEIVDSFSGLIAALFSIALHKEDFPPGTYQPVVRLLSEALAQRICSGPRTTKGNS